MQAADLFAKRVTQADIGRELGVSTQTVSDWHKLWKVGGKKALKRTGGPVGPAWCPTTTWPRWNGPCRRAEGQWLSDRSVDAGPGRRGDREDHRGEVPPRTRLEGAPPDGLEPATAGPKGDGAGRRGHRAVGQRTLAQGKENARARNAWIVFQDESGFSLLPSVRSTGVPRARPRSSITASTGSACRCPPLCASGPTAATPPLCSACSPVPTTTNPSWSSSPTFTATWMATRSPSSGTDFRPIAAEPCGPSSRSSGGGWWSNRSRPTPRPQSGRTGLGNLKGGELANLCLDTIGEAEDIVDQGLCRIGNETRLAFAFLRHCGLAL